MATQKKKQIYNRGRKMFTNLVGWQTLWPPVKDKSVLPGTLL
jgi:hypothetical protein